MENIIYGTMVVLNGKENTPSDIVNVFIPSRNWKTVEQMISGNGQITLIDYLKSTESKIQRKVVNKIEDVLCYGTLKRPTGRNEVNVFRKTTRVLCRRGT